MKLYYYQKTCGNFGDDLNLWLWKKIFPDAFDEDDKKVFFGIGTIINDRIYDRAPNADRIIIFSSGVGSGHPRVEKGQSPEENQVSKTSGSWVSSTSFP